MIAYTPLGNWLVLGSILVTIPYFYRFKQAIDSLSAEDQQRFAGAGALPPWRRVLGAVPILLVIFSSNPGVQLAAGVWWLLQMTLDTRAHDLKLRDAGFAPAFCDRLKGISVLSYIGTLVFVAGMVLR